jgi:hypothetical protein
LTPPPINFDVRQDCKGACLNLWHQLQQPRQSASRLRPYLHTEGRSGKDEGIDRVACIAGIGLEGVLDVSGAHQAVRTDFGLVGEVMEHQDAPAQPVGAHLEARAIDRERVVAAAPGARLVERMGVVRAVLAVVEDELEAPVGGQGCPRCVGKVGEVRHAVAVAHTLDVAVGTARRAAAVALVQVHGVHALRVFRLVAVARDVALVVVGLADQPTERAARVGRVRDPALLGAAVPGGDVVARNGSPEGVRRIGCVRPMLDASEQALDARAVTLDLVDRAEGRARFALRGEVTRDKSRHQVLGSRQNENVRLGATAVLRNPLVGLARDRRQREAPAKAERTVAGAGVIRQGQCETEPRAARAGGNRDAHRAAAGYGIGRKFLADAANGAAALRQAQLRLGWRTRDGQRFVGTPFAVHEINSPSRSHRPEGTARWFRTSRRIPLAPGSLERS